MFNEFRPAFRFLGTFLLIYFVGNLLYGVFIESYDREPDPVTRIVTLQSASLLRFFGYNTSVQDSFGRPTVMMKEEESLVLRVYEGCNGLNVMIVFVAFLFAFKGSIRQVLWFLPFGLVVIHVANLLRVILLYYTALHHQQLFYYFHKYFFTAILYLIVFGLWALWAIKLHGKNNHSHVAATEKN
jgi:exosortase family protein XrtF